MFKRVMLAGLLLTSTLLGFTTETEVMGAGVESGKQKTFFLIPHQ